MKDPIVQFSQATMKKRLLLGMAVATALLVGSVVIQPANAATWITTGRMTTGRKNQTATLLPNGTVLVTGGISSDSGLTNSAELYDPATGMWKATGAMLSKRIEHTATLLPSGKVLVVGGWNGSYLSSAELYDPVTGTWTATGGMTTARVEHTATLLPNGKVLVAGGYGNNFITNSAELYDPITQTWTVTGAMATARADHTATLLPNGKVLIAAGNGAANSAELYDPASGMWMVTGALNTGRLGYHTATLLPNGKVLIAGGYGVTSHDVISSAELYDPAMGTWAATGSLNTARWLQMATLLPNGNVLVAGGAGGGNTAELYVPATGTWTTTGAMAVARNFPTGTLLSNGRVLVAGGQGNQIGVPNPLFSAELYDPAIGTWTATSAMNTARVNHTASLLPNGKVLVAGGLDNVGHGLSAVQLYDAATGTWAATGTLNTARGKHTSTLLPSGKVLVTGGEGSSFNTLSSAELYDPTTGTWGATSAMNTARQYHTATLLLDGKVLVAGGIGTSYLSSAELYDPATGTWTATGTMTTTREQHTATLLPNGKVLVAGGVGNSGWLSSAELYDSTTKTWTATSAMITTHAYHTATLLPNSKVLVAGGYDGSVIIPSAELYDPASGTWTPTGAMIAAHELQTATLLPNEKVLIAGGLDSFANPIPNAEVYDPETGTWIATAALGIARRSHTATLLPNGKVLAAGGSSGNSLSSAELYDVGLGFSASWQPQVASFISPLNLGSNLALTGSRFRGISEGSSGNNQNSSADYPVVQLRSLGNEQTLFLLSTNWSANAFASAPVVGLPPGYALATVFVNGIPGTSSILLIAPPVCDVTPGGLIAWWPAGNNASDIIGARNGTLMNGATFAGGEAGQAFSFDGIDDSMTIGGSPIPPPWTVELWVNRQDSPSYSSVLLVDGATALKLEQYYFTRKVGFTQFGVADYAFNYIAPAGTWVHLAFVGNATTTQLYVNGALQDTVAASIALPLGQFGSDGADDRLKGLVDELSVYNRALSATEIQAISNAGTSGKCLPPVYITSINKSGNNLNLTWQAQRGLTYRVQYKTDLGAVNWTDASGDVTATGSSASKTDVLPVNAPQRFYRVEMFR